MKKIFKPKREEETVQETTIKRDSSVMGKDSLIQFYSKKEIPKQ